MWTNKVSFFILSKKFFHHHHHHHHSFPTCKQSLVFLQVCFISSRNFTLNSLHCDIMAWRLENIFRVCNMSYKTLLVVLFEYTCGKSHIWRISQVCSWHIANGSNASKQKRWMQNHNNVVVWRVRGALHYKKHLLLGEPQHNTTWRCTNWTRYDEDIIPTQQKKIAKEWAWMKELRKTWK